MLFHIRLADRIVEIRSIYDEIYRLCTGYIIPEAVADLIVNVSQKDIEGEAEISWENDHITYPPQHLETAAVLRKIASAMSAYDTFLMHGSVISTEGEGYLITATSGIGKTTRTRLWVDHIPESFVVNGDKPLLKVSGDRIYAYGTPWCGKEGWNRNTSVPLRAIFLLERADDGEESAVTEINLAEAFPFLLRQTFHPEDVAARRKTLRLLQAMAGKVKFFRFRSTPTLEAVQLAWEAARPR